MGTPTFTHTRSHTRTPHPPNAHTHRVCHHLTSAWACWTGGEREPDGEAGVAGASNAGGEGGERCGGARDGGIDGRAGARVALGPPARRQAREHGPPHLAHGGDEQLEGAGARALGVGQWHTRAAQRLACARLPRPRGGPPRGLSAHAH
eukprot:3674856-Rhodomonas_salina.2